MLLSRFGSVLGRYSPRVTTRLVQGSRALSASSALASNGEKKPAVVPVASARGGLTGFLMDKTGVTGAWTLGAGLTAYLLSKELYIINAETVIAVIMGGVIYYLIKKVGKPTAEFLDARSQGILDHFNEDKIAKVKELEQGISEEGKVEEALSYYLTESIDVRHENNAMQLEEEYRRRQHHVNREVKRRLDYQVDVEKLHRQFAQDQMVQWLEKQVIQSITSKQDESVTQSVAELKRMAVN